MTTAMPVPTEAIRPPAQRPQPLPRERDEPMPYPPELPARRRPGWRIPTDPPPV